MKFREFTKIQGELDRHGLLTKIVRVAKDKFQVLVNFEIVKTRKQRRACKNHIIKLHAETINPKDREAKAL